MDPGTLKMSRSANTQLLPIIMLCTPLNIVLSKETANGSRLNDGLVSDFGLNICNIGNRFESRNYH